MTHRITICLFFFLDVELTPIFPISSSTFVATYLGYPDRFNLGSLLTNTLLFPCDVEIYTIKCVHMVLHVQSANYSSLGYSI